MKTKHVPLIVLAVLCAAASVVFAEDKPAANAKLPPGWKAEPIVLCGQCADLNHGKGPGKCRDCLKATPAEALHLCADCSLKAKTCSRCWRTFPKDPTPGLRLELGWLKPDLKNTDPKMSVDSAKSIPIWVTVVNTTKERITAPDFKSIGQEPQIRYTMLFLVKSAKADRILFNQSPWFQYPPSSPPPAPLVFEPGATSFERDLAQCKSQGGALAPGKYTVRAAVGWLVSNELTLIVGAGGVEGPVVGAGDPKLQAAVAKYVEAWKLALKEGKFAQAVEYAKRIAAIDPATGAKLLKETEAYAKQAPTNDATRKMELERAAERQKAMQEEKLKEEVERREKEAQMRRDEELKRQEMNR